MSGLSEREDAFSASPQYLRTSSQDQTEARASLASRFVQVQVMSFKMHSSSPAFRQLPQESGNAGHIAQSLSAGHDAGIQHQAVLPAEGFVRLDLPCEGRPK